MKIVGIIPSRYDSTRFPGKALARLEGKPLIWYACEAARQSGVLHSFFVATDSQAIQNACSAYDFPSVLTRASHRTPTSRVKEASDRIPADLYVMLGGDEPLVKPQDIRLIVEAALKPEGPVPFVINASGLMNEPSEVLDPSNLKLVCNEEGLGIYLSRSPIPYPHGTLCFKYRKFVGIGVYTREALDFFASSPPGPLEQTEGCDLLRFIERGRPVRFVDLPGRTLSVDTPADLLQAGLLLRERNKS